MAERSQQQDLVVAEFRALLAAAADGIVVIDASGRIIEFNPAAERMFGIDVDDAVGQPVEILMPGPYRAEHAGYLERYLKTGEARIIGIGREVEGRHANGTVFPIALSVGEVAGADGPRRFIGIIRDLSAQKTVEKEARDLEYRLAQVSRYNLISEMAAGIAHEINQPLGAIVTYAQAAKRLMNRDVWDQAALLDICDKIAAQADRAGKVIQNLRDFISKQESRREVVEINEVVRDALSLIETNAHAEDVELELEYHPGPLPVEGDSIQLQQVLLNLARNAIDAMRDAGRGAKRLRISTRRAAEGKVCIVVSDTGPGIPTELADSVFHPFVTTKSDGLGIGLAISRTIVQSHGGQLKHAPGRPEGTVFTIELPYHDEG